MIIDLPSTTTAAVNHALIDIRERGGAVALGRVLTLVIVTDDSAQVEQSIEAANEASKEHPCRVLVVARGLKRAGTRLDAQIRVGGDAGASEVLVLRLYGPLADHGDSVVIPLLRFPPRIPSGSWRSAASPTPLRPLSPSRHSRVGGPPTPPGTRTWRGPGSPRGAPCLPRPSICRPMRTSKRLP